MINIAYIVSTLKRSGPINVLYNIIKNLDSNEFNVYIICLSAERKNSRKKDFEEIGCKVLSLNLGRVQFFFKARKMINSIIKKEKIKILHGHGIRADFLISKFSKINEIKICSTLHNYPYHDYPMTYGKVKGYIMAYCHLRYLKKIDGKIACSKSVSSMLKEKNNYLIDYIQNGVDLEKYNCVNNQTKMEMREKLNIPLDKKVFISVGHLSDRKDPITIIKAFKKIDNVFLIFLGDGYLKDECLKEIGDSQNIRLDGFVENVSEYLQASDYFISASKAEGLPNTVMEAMACGLPCVLSDIPPHNEILEYDSDVGKMFNIEDPEDLVKKISELIEISYEEISDRAIKLIETNLSAKIMSEKYKNLYLELLKKG